MFKKCFGKKVEEEQQLPLKYVKVVSSNAYVAPTYAMSILKQKRGLPSVLVDFIIAPMLLPNVDVVRLKYSLCMLEMIKKWAHMAGKTLVLRPLKEPEQAPSDLRAFTMHREAVQRWTATKMDEEWIFYHKMRDVGFTKRLEAYYNQRWYDFTILDSSKNKLEQRIQERESFIQAIAASLGYECFRDKWMSLVLHRIEK